MNVIELTPEGERLKVTPKLELDLWQAHQIHRALVKVHRQAQIACEQAYNAYTDAIQVRGDSYLALAQFEPYLAELEERYGFRSTGRTDFVTLDKETP